MIDYYLAIFAGVVFILLFGFLEFCKKTIDEARRLELESNTPILIHF